MQNIRLLLFRFIPFPQMRKPLLFAAKRSEQSRAFIVEFPSRVSVATIGRGSSSRAAIHESSMMEVAKYVLL